MCITDLVVGETYISRWDSKKYELISIDGESYRWRGENGGEFNTDFNWVEDRLREKKGGGGYGE